LGFTIGPPDNYIGIVRYKNNRGDYYQVYSYNASRSESPRWYTFFQAPAGKLTLGLFYNGTTASAYIAYPGGSTLHAFPSDRVPTWTTAPKIGLFADVHAEDHIRFSVDDVVIYRPASSSARLSLTKSGLGSGAITSLPSGVDCGGTCTASYGAGSVITLTAIPADGSVFGSWSGCDAVDGNNCTVNLMADRQITANFNLSVDYTNIVQKLYVGYYQRPADPEGMLWIKALADVDSNHDGDFTGENIIDVLAQFAFSNEARALYNGDITNDNIETVVNSIYMGLFNRQAEGGENGGLTLYVNAFKTGGETTATILWHVLNGAQNEDMLSVNNKVAAANLFTRTVDPDLDGQNLQVTYGGDVDTGQGRTFLGSVTWDNATVPTQEAITAFMKSNIANPGDPILSQ
jgi:hypothetical protein